MTTDRTFDVLDQLTSVTTHPSATTNLTTSYILDPNGQPLSRTTADGVTVSHSYDALSRLSSVTGPSLAISYGYDAASRRTAMTDATGVTTYQYDRLGRTTQIAAPAGTLGYAYDRDGNRTQLVYPGGQTVTYAYSPGARLQTVTDWGGRVTSYTYKPSGLVASVRLPNDVLTSYTYDLAQRLTRIETSRQGAALFVEVYALDPEGNRTRRDGSALAAILATSTTYRYDGLSRLTNADRTLTLSGQPSASESFVLDAATNIASRTGPSAAYVYDTANRLTSDGSRAFVFDNADRLTQRGTDTFAYDALARMTSATIEGITSTYTYDGDGLLRSRTTGVSTTSYLWDASVGPAPLLVAGGERIVHGLGPLYRVRSDEGYDTFVRDALGSVRAEVSPAGAVTNAYDYRAYGDVAASIAGPPPLLGFAGELRDPSGLVHLRARWYDPVMTGRFLTRDPEPGDGDEPVTLNAYAYAHANPTMKTDPEGRWAGLAQRTWEVVKSVAATAAPHVAFWSTRAVFGAHRTLERATGAAASAPSVADPKLRNYVEQIYKGVANPGRTGDGTTMAAIRHFLKTGETTFGSDHLIKGRELASGLAEWLRRSGRGDPSDRAIAEALQRELVEALAGR